MKQNTSDTATQRSEKLGQWTRLHNTILPYDQGDDNDIMGEIGTTMDIALKE
jgi:hypothetical protein